MHVQPIQMRYPELGVTFDVNPTEAIAERQRVMRHVSTNRIAIGSPHLEPPGFFYLRTGTDRKLICVPLE